MGTYYAYACHGQKEYFHGVWFDRAEQLEDSLLKHLDDAWNAKRPTSALVTHVLYELMTGPWRGHGVCVENDGAGYPWDRSWSDVTVAHRDFVRDSIRDYVEREAALDRRDAIQLTTCLSSMLTELGACVPALLEPPLVDAAREVTRRHLERLVKDTSCALVAHHPVEWSTEPPTEPGYYWAELFGVTQPVQVVDLAPSGGDRMLDFYVFGGSDETSAMSDATRWGPRLVMP